MNDQDMELIVRRVLSELGMDATKAAGAADISTERPSAVATIDEKEIPDIRQVDYRMTYDVKDPVKPDQFAQVKARTWARIGLGRSGPRYTTSALLRFWADNASAQDAVFTDVDPAILEELGLFSVQTKCTSKDEYLTRPDLGAQFDDQTLAEIKKRCAANPQVQIVVSDGLSSTAVEANARDLLPALQQGLTLHGLSVGTPFFVKYGRVRSMEPISEALGATVTCVLLGERPGLATPESLSAYLAYRARVGMPESDRNCISNIHREGTGPVEAGAHIADLMAEMIRQQASGINLKL